jgi:putative transposase
MQVIGAVEFAEGATIRQRIKTVSERTFQDEHGNAQRFTWRTISTWLYRYKIQGTTAMEPKERSDKGKPRKISHEELAEAVEKALPAFHSKRPYKRHIYRVCIEKAYFTRDQIAPNTFSRLVDKYELLKPLDQTTNKLRLAFSKRYANEMWQADTMFGPMVKNGKTATQAKLIAFIDDASRVICHGQFVFSENAPALIAVLRSALYKRGLPEQIYVDNGSIYCGRELTTICARLGILLSHTQVRDAAAKGKIERFFRTCRAQFLTKKLDLSTLDALNAQFTQWVENQYNATPHSAINMRPIDRFGVDLPRIRFLPPNQDNDEHFYLEDTRVVRADNTFSLKNTRYEAPRDVRNKKIQVRYDRHHLARVIVYYKDQRMGEAQPLDPVSNDRPPKRNNNNNNNSNNPEHPQP